MAAEPLLTVEDLRVSYGGIRALHGVALEVREGEIVTLIGANGAGKSTLLRTLSGLVAAESGRIRFAGRDLGGVPAHRRVALGLAHVPEGRGLFGNLTVAENLRLATWTRKPGVGARRDRPGVTEDYARVFALFPRLAERRGQLAGSLSGGEQQMLAIGRALMTHGRLLLLDEPSMGLAPVLVREIFATLAAINAAGTTILLVEQNARQALKLAQRAYVLETGRLLLSGPADDLRQNSQVLDAYLGELA
jgi:branched-chain amino acid transport system ATP-binding protein